MCKYLKKYSFLILVITVAFLLSFGCNKKVDLSKGEPVVPPPETELSSLYPSAGPVGYNKKVKSLPYESETIPGETYKAYEEDKTIVMVEETGRYTLQLDLSKQKLLLDIADYSENTSFSEEEPVLYPTLEGAIRPNSFISASIISAKAKQFDDGLYAAVEIAAQEGTGNFDGKKVLLANIYEILKESDGENESYCRAFILSAAELGGQELEKDKVIEVQAEDIKKEFLSNPLKSKLIGFYTWTDELGDIFRQDRLLQYRFCQGNYEEEEQYADIITKNSSSLAEALVKSDKKDTYVEYIELVEHLTNPLLEEVSDFRPLIDEDYKSKKSNNVYAFFPPSRSYETVLMKKLFSPTDKIPDDFILADRLIEEVQAGNLNLTPGENSGWYDYQTYSLEPLVLPEKFPEAKKLRYSESYKDELLEFFKSFLALMRETHTKQMEIPCMETYGEMSIVDPKPVMTIRPELSIEPLVTYYLRRAYSYNFIHQVLINTFGEEGLKEMHRLTPDGAVKENLNQELTHMERLFYGAAWLSSYEIGIEPVLPTGYEPAVNKNISLKTVMDWMKNIDKDTDITKDNRMMVPVFYNIQKGQTKVWVFLGYGVEELNVSFSSYPGVTVFDKSGKELSSGDVDIEFSSATKNLICPVFAELYVDEILNREEFQTLCDKYSTSEEITVCLKEVVMVKVL